MIIVIMRMLFGFLVLASRVLAEVSSNVPANLPNYDYIDRLEAYGCAATTFRSFKPQVQSDLLEALTRYAEKDCKAPEWLLEERQIMGRKQLQSEASLKAFVFREDILPLSGMLANTPPSNSLNEGRPLYNSFNLYAELAVHAATGADSGFALSATPGFFLGMDTNAASGARFYFQEGYAKWVKNKFEVTLGRLSPRFGDTRHGELILSGAARPMDVLKLGLRPHWIKGLEDLGPLTVESFVTLDGNETGLAGARLFGFQFGLRPLTFLEFGLLRLEHFGGENGPGLFSSQSQSSWAWQWQVWGPDHLFKLYNQLFFSSLGSVSDWFRKDMSYLWGLWFPKLPFGDIRLEYVRTQDSAYSHPLYVQGWSLADTPLGHPLGNAGEGFYLDFTLPPIASFRPRLGLNFESRNMDSQLGSPEYRTGFEMGLTKRWLVTELSATAQFTSVRNYHYTNESRSIATLVTSLRYLFF